MLLVTAVSRCRSDLSAGPTPVDTPSNAPDHLPHRSGLEDAVAAAIDRYSTRWGGDWTNTKDNPK